jgi:putative flippase GtrA
MPVVDTATELLNKVTRGRGEQIMRFGMASIIGIVITQGLLIGFHGLLNINASVSNLLAVMISAAPVFVLNKRWVWGQLGPASVKREIVPFWAFTLLGLVISTVLVTVVDHYTDRTWPVMAANIAGFGLVWVSKFLFLDSVVFASSDEPAVAES